MADNKTGFELYSLDIEGLDAQGNPTGYIVKAKEGGKETTLKPAQFGQQFRAANRDMLVDAVSRYKNNPPKSSEVETEQAAVVETPVADTTVMNQPETGEGNAPVAPPSNEESQEVKPPPPPQKIALTDTGQTTQTSTESKAVPQEYLDALMDADKAVAGANISMAQAQDAAAKAETALHTKNALELQEQNDEMAARRAEREMEFQDTMKLADDLLLELRDQKVDPTAFWTEGGTGRRVGAAISILLGGLGQTLTGAQNNAAWDIINQSIDRDIAAQKANLKKADLAAGRANELMSQLRQKQLGDAEIDKLFRIYAIHKLQELESNLNAVASASKSPLAHAQAEIANAKLQQEQAQLAAELNSSVTRSSVQRTDRTTEKPLTKGKGKAGSNTPAAIRTRLISTNAIVNGLDDAISKIDMSDTGLTEVAQRKFAKKLMDYGIFPPGEDGKEQAAEFARTNQLLSRVVVAASGAATTDQERAFYESFMPMFANDPRLAKASAEELVQFMKREYNSVLKSAQTLETEGIMGLKPFDLGGSSSVGFTPAGQ